MVYIIDLGVDEIPRFGDVSFPTSCPTANDGYTLGYSPMLGKPQWPLGAVRIETWNGWPGWKVESTWAQPEGHPHLAAWYAYVYLYILYTLWFFNIAMEAMVHLQMIDMMIYRSKMVTFHSYVK